MKITTLLKVTIFCAFSILSREAIAQVPEQDCITAITICEPVRTFLTPYNGAGYVANEVNSSISCLGNGEQNSSWFRYRAATSGDLNFTINPLTPSNDYDWAVFNITQASCTDIYNDTLLIESCSFSPITGPTGPNGGGSPASKPVIPAIAGEVFVIVVTNFSIANQGGFTIDFTASTATFVCDAYISENDVPEINIYPNPAQDVFVIDLDRIYDEVNLDIFSTNGIRVHQEQLFNAEDINVNAGLSAGIYFLRINTGIRIITKKLIIK